MTQQEALNDYVKVFFFHVSSTAKNAQISCHHSPHTNTMAFYWGYVCDKSVHFLCNIKHAKFWLTSCWLLVPVSMGTN